MWLLPDQVDEILRSCGLGAAAAGSPGERILEMGIEPALGAIRIELRRGVRGEPAEPAGPEAAVDVDARYGLWESHARELLSSAGLGASSAALVPAILRLWRAFREHEMLRLEVGLELGGGQARFASGRMLCDDNAIHRNERLQRLAALAVPDAPRVLKSLGIDYVELDGPVGLISVGAGETLATMDLLAAAGARAACFLDMSGGFGLEAATAALRRVAALPGVRALLVNIFGGLTRVDLVAESLAKALDLLPGFSLPLVVRLEGTEAERGRELLARRGLRSRPVLREAVEAAAALARGEAA